MQAKKGVPLLWEELSWIDLKELVKKLKIAILPVGAIEQHGRHLPLCVDSLEGYEVAKRVSAKTGVPVLPPIVYGCSQGHGAFPGTLSLRPETLEHCVKDVSAWAYQSGIRKLIILNSHAWNLGPLLSAREDLRYDFPDLRIRVINTLDRDKELAEEYISDVARSDHGHGNLAETSEILAIRPDLVHLEKAVDEEDTLTFFDYRMDQISKSGSLGKPTNATKQYGAKLLERIAGRLAFQIEQAIEEHGPRKSAVRAKGKKR